MELSLTPYDQRLIANTSLENTFEEVFLQVHSTAKNRKRNIAFATKDPKNAMLFDMEIEKYYNRCCAMRGTKDSQINTVVRDELKALIKEDYSLWLLQDIRTALIVGMRERTDNFGLSISDFREMLENYRVKREEFFMANTPIYE
jgi:hypothetical protein